MGPLEQPFRRTRWFGEFNIREMRRCLQRKLARDPVGCASLGDLVKPKHLPLCMQPQAPGLSLIP